MANNKIRDFKRRVQAPFAALLLTLCAAAPLAAQSSEFACSGLMQSGTIPSVEGTQGMFYRTVPDLMMSHEITVQSARDLAHLSDMLAAQGTTLIYVPVPTKALGQPQNLPWAATDLGYDIDIAATVYDADVQRLTELGVQTANARHVLAQAAQEAPVFFGPDPRLTPHGIRTLAQVVAQDITGAPSYATLPKTRFKAGLGTKTALLSNMRLDLQEHCEKDLPVLSVDQVIMTQGPEPQDLFSGQNVQIAVISSAIIGPPELGFAHHLQEQTNLKVGHYSLPKGGSLAAMSAYITSQEFQNNRPAFLVWNQPIWQNLGLFGDQPMQELIAAAGTACDITLPLQFDKDRNLYQADLSSLDHTRPHTLFFDSGVAGTGAVRFSFASQGQDVRSRTIYRAPDQVLTGRFYMPMSGLWPEGADHVDIKLGGALGKTPGLYACQQEEHQ